MSAAMLTIDGLEVGYDGPSVVRNVSISVSAGEVVALLGSNGAGKSTTLRAISGTIRPRRGTIHLDGKDITSMPPQAIARLGVAHIPEGRGVFAGLTVAEHFRLRHRGETTDVEGALRQFPALGELLNRRAGLLSGGEQQMLAVARAIARRPRLLLIDELSLGLAPVIVERLLPAIRSYADDNGAAVLLVEQHFRLALQNADRGYVLARGEVTLTNSAQELGEDRERLVASYLGDTGASEADDSGTQTR